MKRRAGWAMALFSLPGITSCAFEDDKYAVPDRVCGVPMREEVVRALLTDGEELTQRGHALPVQWDNCTLEVDGDPEVRITFSREKKFHHPLEEYSEKFNNGEDIALEFTGKGGVDSDDAVIIAKCGLAERPYVIGKVSLAPPYGTPRTAPPADVSRFLVDYMAGALQELECPSVK
ncbi:hypothetical protein JJV70_10090 [Streptomyces sp. JJ66]|uniref:hypothetical protein n=1 Tax=Streptomyces sp. JJ66 TaxID=2803843 RepID=UPI001C59664B|nr:hypothetical protein [Streptomyces sp. JJ66]MBW1602453.1 hypothetical protein [Streptomyces sp. JJ66]